MADPKSVSQSDCEPAVYSFMLPAIRFLFPASGGVYWWVRLARVCMRPPVCCAHLKT